MIYGLKDDFRLNSSHNKLTMAAEGKDKPKTA